MALEYVCDEDVLKNDEKKTYVINGEKILLIKLEDGYFATQAKCPHMGAPLEKANLLDNDIIQCRFHHAEFNIKTGKAEQWACFPPGIQALNFFRGEKNLKTYTLKLEDNKVFIEL